MSAADPLEVTFRLPDEQTALWLDRMIDRLGLTPDEWLTAVITMDKQKSRQQTASKLNDLLGRIQADNIDGPVNPDKIDTRGRKVPPRPASARAPKPDSSWRRR